MGKDSDHGNLLCTWCKDDPPASFEPSNSSRDAVLSKRPHFYAQIFVTGQWPEILIDIVKRINSGCRQFWSKTVGILYKMPAYRFTKRY